MLKLGVFLTVVVHIFSFPIEGSEAIIPSGNGNGKALQQENANALDHDIILEKIRDVKSHVFRTLEEIRQMVIEDNPAIGRSISKSLETAKTAINEEGDKVIRMCMDKTLTKEKALPHVKALKSKLLALKDKVLKDIKELSPPTVSKIMGIAIELYNYVKNELHELEDLLD